MAFCTSNYIIIKDEFYGWTKSHLEPSPRKNTTAVSCSEFFYSQADIQGVYLKNIFDFTSTISITQFKSIDAPEFNLETAAFIKFIYFSPAALHQY